LETSGHTGGYGEVDFFSLPYMRVEFSDYDGAVRAISLQPAV
jgi:hypothetical protein